MQVLDRRVGHAAQILGRAGALAQHRHQRLGALQQLRKIRRPAGPAKFWATLFRLGHHEPLFLAESPLSGSPAATLYPARRLAARCSMMWECWSRSASLAH